MQMCPFCGKVYDESEYTKCPYCRGYRSKYVKGMAKIKKKEKEK